ncbi:Bacteriohemerythrin [Gammaproteobacteria bacterium]
MAFVRWEEKYRLGINPLDEQHQQLFDIINKLHDAMLREKSKKVVGELLKKLMEGTALHFSDEEIHMEQNAYPGYAAHKKEHHDLAKQMTEVVSNFNGGKTELSTPVMYFLKDWLYKHIVQTDLPYTSYLIDKGVLIKRRTLR